MTQDRFKNKNWNEGKDLEELCIHYKSPDLRPSKDAERYIKCHNICCGKDLECKDHVKDERENVQRYK